MTDGGQRTTRSHALALEACSLIHVDSSILIALAVALIVIVLLVVVLQRKRGARAEAPRAADQRSATDQSLRQRLSKSRSALTFSLAGVFASDQLTDQQWEELEDALISADVGPGVASEIVDSVRADRPEDGVQARDALVEELEALLANRDRTLRLDGSPAVVLVVGVNGTGKTTSIAKIANGLVEEDRTVVLGAADTFRAAADAQLREWGSRVGVLVVSGVEGADPASVAHDAVTAARENGDDVVIVDTAGRLHNQKNLMDELGKVMRVLESEASGVSEVLLVLDGTTGQNGITQAKAFTEAVGVTGVVLTKLDGTSRGGIAIAVERELGIPVKFVGVGEGMQDLIPFVPEEFVEALLAP
jgi:fused signal recognition particle receptor